MKTVSLHVDLTNDETLLLRGLEKRARSWPVFRWIGLASGLTLLLSGGLDAFLACRTLLGQGASPSAALVVAALSGSTLSLSGFVLLTHIVARWQSHHTDRLLIKLASESRHEQTGQRTGAEVLQ